MSQLPYSRACARDIRCKGCTQSSARLFQLVGPIERELLQASVMYIKLIDSEASLHKAHMPYIKLSSVKVSCSAEITLCRKIREIS